GGLARAVPQPRNGTGRRGLRPRLQHRQGQARRRRHRRSGPRRQDPAAGCHRPGRLEGRRGGGTVMARRLVQLKLRLLTNALRSSTGAKVSFITSVVFAVLLAIGTFVILAALRGQTAAVAPTAAGFTVFAVGWPIPPLFSLGPGGPPG